MTSVILTTPRVYQSNNIVIIKILAGCLSGTLMPLAFAPFNLWLITILLLIPLWWGWSLTPKQAALQGYLFGLGMFGFGINWIYISLYEYANVPLVLAILATILVVVVLSTYPAVIGYISVIFVKKLGGIYPLLIIPGIWTILEWVRSWLFGGFPWLLIGYSQIDSPIGKLAPYIGIFGIGWVTVWSSILLWIIIKSKNLLVIFSYLLILLLLVLGLNVLGNIAWTKPVDVLPLRITLIQGNISQEEKWQVDQLNQIINLYTGLSFSKHKMTDIIIWPETAIPGFYQYLTNFFNFLDNQARADHVRYLIGILTEMPEKNIFHNSVVIIGEPVKFYHKRHLVPFGEYLPLGEQLGQYLQQWIKIPMANLQPGNQEQQPFFYVKGQPVGISICFEAAFSDIIRTALPKATWLVNVSNDAWFKDSLAPHQHLQMIRMRALETGRYIARATNNGISAIINDRGILVNTAPQFCTQVIHGMVQPRSGITPYTKLGDSPILGLASLSLVLGLYLTSNFSKKNFK